MEKTFLERVRDAVSQGLDDWENFRDNPEFGGSIVDCIADRVVKVSWI